MAWRPPSEGCISLGRSLYGAALKQRIDKCRIGIRRLAEARDARRQSRDIDIFLEDAARQTWTGCDLVIYGACGGARQGLMRSLEALSTGDQVVSIPELRRAAVERVRSLMEDTGASFQAELDPRASALIDAISERLPEEADEMDAETAGMIEELWRAPSFKSALAKHGSYSLHRLDDWYASRRPFWQRRADAAPV